MTILLWLLPPVLVTAAAMLWVSWLGREGRGEVDRDVALRRMGQALEGRPGRLPGRLHRSRRAPAYVAPATVRDRSSGVAVRRPRPGPVAPVGSGPEQDTRRQAS